MLIGREIAQVNALCNDSARRKLQLVRARDRFHEWTREVLGTPAGLTWAFAVGALVGAKPRRVVATARKGQRVVSFASAAMLAGRMASSAISHLQDVQAESA